ncbi:unnamed protein product [Cuscuta europaea]|uniref:Uncharacterized protein n=1 Tax=Cuscuta europaea TaxID=41803 RepID=A0A9P0ZYM0_CUSEU|nr:unnamed protein product [Cuscuta europaea]
MPCFENSAGHADSESAVCNLAKVPMHDFKPFECNDYAHHTTEEKPNTKDNSGILFHFNDSKEDADPFVFEEKPVLDSYNGTKDNKSEDGLSPVKDDQDLMLHLNLCKEDGESNDNAIKDICIDVGIPLVGKKLIENLNTDTNGIFGEDAQKEALSEEAKDMLDMKIDDLKSVVSDCPISSSLEDNVKESKGTYVEDDLVKPFESRCSTSEEVSDDCQSPEEVIIPGKDESSCDHAAEPELLLEMQTSEDKAPANLLMGGQDGFADGETSFSSVGPISGLITYSGLAPHPGSISIRSDSSTTSTRSFAFPVLQSEWNSSPVRMSKAERRYGKQRGWRQGLLCCRF